MGGPRPGGPVREARRGGPPGVDGRCSGRMPIRAGQPHRGGRAGPRNGGGSPRLPPRRIGWIEGPFEPLAERRLLLAGWQIRWIETQLEPVPNRVVHEDGKPYFVLMLACPLDGHTGRLELLARSVLIRRPGHAQRVVWYARARTLRRVEDPDDDVADLHPRDVVPPHLVAEDYLAA